MTSRFLLPALAFPVLLALPTPAEASCSGLRYGSKEYAQCEEDESEMLVRAHEESEKSLLLKVSVGSHTQTISWYDYRKTGLCELTGLDGVHTLSPVEAFSDPSVVSRPYGAGALFMHVSCKDGERHGDQIKYHASGAVQERTPFEDGEPHGISESFNDSNRITTRNIYDDGDLEVSYFFWPDGMEQKTEHLFLWRTRTTYWKDGKLFTGTWTRQNLGGHITTQLQDGLFHGSYEEYRNGVVTDRRTYEYGKYVK